MASMQHDFIHPRQLDDVKAIRAAIKSFSMNMKRMMLLMKDLGSTLEQVSHSFDALTSLSFSDDGVRQYVHHFSEELTHMMEGTAFQNYNKLVHEEVLAPVERLRVSLKDTEEAAKSEKDDFDRYKKAKRKVDTQEKSYAAKSKALDTSRSYPKLLRSRDDSLLRLQKSKDNFEVKFVGLVSEVEKVSATTLKRYLDLNAGYMTSVVDALTKTDPTVEEAVALYREEQKQRRQSAINQRCAEVDADFRAASASTDYRRDPAHTSGAAAAPAVDDAGRGTSPNSTKSSLSPQQTNPSTVAAATRKPSVNNAAPSSSVQEKASPMVPAAKGPPTAAVAPIQSSTLNTGCVAQRGAFTVTMTTVSSHPAALPAESASNSRVMEEADEYEDFGSVSQVGTAGRVAPPLYSFSRGPLSQVSSVQPRSGYVAAEDASLAKDFLTKMESKSLTASEVCAARAPQQ
ncbi:hypothetical protein ABL78_6962 [Leptomonas seymouri]|uniref:BAR domain-containing protein n=1 Tax=Leptomonas seymouri TaxID=5684 RepID=A0A0N0P3S1_LEPSE|nr:hypothetical protein ABL78_6962 [Leptomonas seymouri]|eukprot:KPI83987.1 hypothetical protein ABL78_6962 [Leptomonas seymouri]